MTGALQIPGGWIAASLLALAGLVACFAGSRLVRFALGLAGFVALGSLAAALVGLVTQSPLWAAVAFVAAGVVGGAVAGALLVPGLFLLGLAFGHTVASHLVPSEIACWAIAALAGGVFVVMKRRVLAMGTALLGSLLVVEGLVAVVLDVDALSRSLAPLIASRPGAIVLALAWVVLAFLGYRAQLGGRKKEEKEG